MAASRVRFAFLVAWIFAASFAFGQESKQPKQEHAPFAKPNPSQSKDDRRQDARTDAKDLSTKAAELHELLEKHIALDDTAVTQLVKEIGYKTQSLEFAVHSGTPIKIGGGSMTLRFDVAGNTVPVGHLPFCVNVDTSRAHLRDHKDGSVTLKLGITGEWEMRLYGRTPDGFQSSKKGIILTAQKKSCDGFGTGTSVMVDLFDEINHPALASFYDDDDKVDTDFTTVKRRYLDKDVTKCSGPNGGNGDEDICERMSIVTVSSKDSASPIDSQECKHGECVVWIGR